MWPRQILELGKQFNLMIRLQNILKASLQDVLRMSWIRHEDVFNTSWICLEDVFVDVLKTSWQDVLKTSSKHLQDVLRGAWILYENAKLRMKINLNKLRNARSCDGICSVWINDYIEGIRKGGLDGLPFQLQASSSETTTCNIPIF